MTAAEELQKPTFKKGVYYTEQDLVRMLPHFGKTYWTQKRHTGGGPKYKQPSPRKVLYLGDDMIEWLENSTRESTSDGRAD